MRYRFLVLGVLLVAGCREPKWAAEGGFEDASSDAGLEDALTWDSSPGLDSAPLEDAAEADAETDAGVVDCYLENPAGCEPGRLKGPTPTCACLTGCLPGFHWTSFACEADTTDAG